MLSVPSRSRPGVMHGSAMRRPAMRRPAWTGGGSGLVNVAHQLGGSLGLGILTVIFVTAGSGALNDGELLAYRIAASFTGIAGMLILAQVNTLIAQPLVWKRAASQLQSS